MLKLKILTLVFFCVLPISLSASAQNFAETAGLSPFWNYKTFETENFRITFQEGTEQFAKKSADYLEQAHQILSPILKWTPRTKTQVLVTDGTDSANGFAAPPLRIGIVLYAVPLKLGFQQVMQKIGLSF